MPSFHEILLQPPGGDPQSFGYDWGGSFGPGHNTHIFSGDSGYEDRSPRWLARKGQYTVGYEVRDLAVLTYLKAFYMCRYGRAYGFRFKDLLEYSSAANGRNAPASTDQPLAQDIDGNWRLAKWYNGIPRFIVKPVAGSMVFSGGGSASTTTGIVSGQSGGTAGFLFHVPVRFDCKLDGVQVQPNTFGVVSVVLKELIYNIKGV